MEKSLVSAKEELLSREKRIGITVSFLDLLQEDAGQAPFDKPYVSLKTLYSDFVVREISPFYNAGKPLELEPLPSKDTATQRLLQESAAGGDGLAKQMPALAPLKRERASLFDAAKQDLVREAFHSLLNTEDLRSLMDGLAEEKDAITLVHVTEKEKRTQIHHAVRKVFGVGYISSTKNGAICIHKATEKDKREDRRRSNPIKTRAFLHFTVYKENFDSNQAIFFLSKQVGINKRQVQFCGTKDKRAVTLQRMAVQDFDPARLCTVNERSCGAGHNVKVCGFQIRDHGLSLGDSLGNHFRIVLRLYNCAENSGGHLSSSRVAEWQRLLQANGVVNFFGPQRFGTTSVLTSDVGVCLLKGEFDRALYLIFLSKSMFVPALSGVVPLVEAKKYAAALEKTPYYCSQERDVLKFLVDHDRDIFGAFCAMSRTMAMLYFHAVQSLVWNQMASARVAVSRQCLVGDLVLHKTYEERTRGGTAADSSTPVTTADTTSTATAIAEKAGPVEEGEGEKKEEEKLPSVYALKPTDDLSLFSLADVVLPLPGPDRDLQFPETHPCSRADYEAALTRLGVATLLTAGGEQQQEQAEGTRLPPATKATPGHKYSSALLKKFHFHGAYRAIGVMPKDLRLELVQVKGWTTPIIPTDLQGLTSAENEGGHPSHEVAENEKEKEKEEITALVAEFVLPPGCYATSVLREFAYAVSEKTHSTEAPEE